MTAITLKKEIHKAIDLTDDNSILEAVYTILNKTNSNYSISDDDLKMIELRREAYLKGKAKTISLSSIRKKASKHFK